eukprot:11197864-Lingulodinium_polyedra.AAC.1
MLEEPAPVAEAKAPPSDGPADRATGVALPGGAASAGPAPAPRAKPVPTNGKQPPEGRFTAGAELERLRPDLTDLTK